MTEEQRDTVEHHRHNRTFDMMIEIIDAQESELAEYREMMADFVDQDGDKGIEMGRNRFLYFSEERQLWTWDTWMDGKDWGPIEEREEYPTALAAYKALKEATR